MRDTSGRTRRGGCTKYVFLLLLIAIVVILIMSRAGGGIQNLFHYITTNLPQP